MLWSGYGYAGRSGRAGSRAAGADVLLIEKMPDPGGISITSGGNVRTVKNAEEGFQYLRASNGGTTPDSVLRALATGLQQMPSYFEKLCAVNGATIDHRQADGNYPFPGSKTFGYVSIKHVPDFNPAETYPFVSSYVPIERAAGVRLFKVIEDNIRARKLRVMLSTSAKRLITGARREVCGLEAEHEGRLIRIKARRAVILLPVVALKRAPSCKYSSGRKSRSSTCAIWAIPATAFAWHRTSARRCGICGTITASTVSSTPTQIIPSASAPNACRTGFRANRARGCQNAVDRHRSPRPPLHERIPALHPGHDLAEHGGVRWSSMSYLRIPSYMVMDMPGRGVYPIVSPTFNDRRFKFEWSETTLRELEAKILHKAQSIGELAALMKIDATVLEATISEWNEACDARDDPVYQRPPTSMVKIATPPFYFAEVWPICSEYPWRPGA